jgi:hypothetical protein
MGGQTTGGPQANLHNCFMNRPVVIAALLMSMLLQAVSLGGHWTGATNPADSLHAMLHWSGLSHHHDHHVSQAQADDDGGFEAFAEELASATLQPQQSYHQDQSADSNHHMGQDACLSAMGPVPAGLGGAVVEAGGQRPLVLPQAEPADPCLAGPRRPPKHLA